MDLFLAISQATGVALAAGYRAFLAPLLVAVLARANAGVDFDGSGWQFLESLPFIVAMVALTAATALYERPPRKLPFVVLGIAAGTLGALEFAGLLAAEGYDAAPGLPAGAACAVLGLVAVRTFVGGAVERLAARGEQSAAGTLGTLPDAASLVTAAAAVFVSPLALVALAFSIWILINNRRRASKKYEGLRILR